MTRLILALRTSALAVAAASLTTAVTGVLAHQLRTGLTADDPVETWNTVATLHMAGGAMRAFGELVLLLGGLMLLQRQPPRAPKGETDKASRRRVWLALATAAFALVLGLMAREAWEFTDPAQPLDSDTMAWMWVASIIITYLGLGCWLRFGWLQHRDRPRLDRLLPLIYGVSGGLFVAGVLYGQLERNGSEVRYYYAIVTHLIAKLTFVAASWRMAAAVERGRSTNPKTEPLLDHGEPLRRVGSVIRTRILIGVLLSVLMIVLLRSKSFPVAQALYGLGVMVGLVLSAILIAALLDLLRLPNEAGRPAALAIAVYGLLLAGALDVLGAVMGIQLIGLMEAASKASSPWALPDMSRIEILRGSSAWLAAGTQVTGSLALLALLFSLRTTADWLGDKTCQDGIRRSLGLFGLTSVLALVLLSFISSDGPTTPLLLTAGVLFVLALGMLVTVLRAFAALASALDERGERAQ